MIKPIIFLGIALMLAGCAPEVAPSEDEPAGFVTFIFDALPEYKHNQSRGVVQYVDDHFIKQKLAPYEHGDTLTVNTTRDVLGITHILPFQEKDPGPTTYMNLNYLLQNGDTVRFSYDGFNPHAEVLNRDVLPHDLNYDLMAWKALYARNVPVRGYMFSFPFNADWTDEERDRNFKRYVEQVYLQDQDEVAQENQYLDSLFQNRLISEDNFQYHKAVNYFTLLDQDVRRARVDHYVKQQPGRVAEDDQEVDMPGYIPDQDFEMLAAQGIIQFPLSDYVAHRFQIPTVTETYDGSGLRYPDYPVKFDSTLQADWLPQKAKEVLLFDDLQGIMREYPVAYRLQYMSTFKEFASDSVMVHHIADQYKLEGGGEEDMILEDHEGALRTFEEVLASHAGKVVYVDWWASWCGPCIRVMPDMKAIEEQWAGEDVVVLYLSVDENQETWLETVNDHHIRASTNSYRLVNKYVSAEYEAFNVQFIPRYFLIDSNGSITEDFAPGPDEERLQTLIPALVEADKDV